jgi:ABC-type branched-subunit amino acid transport system ATPase component
MTPTNAKTAPPAARASLLRVEGVVKRFGGVVALDGLTLELEDGESVGITGTTGCGKTTLVDVVTGFVRPDRGRVWLAGQEITQWPPHRIVRAGIARTFQSPRVGFPFTVEQNLQAAILHRRLRGSGRRQVVDQILAMVNLANVRERVTRSLSLGEVRRVEVGRALATGGRVLVLDEPCASLGPADAAEVLSVLRRLRREGRAMLIVAHAAALLQTLCDRVAVIKDGRAIRHA